jgi:hypothetical protein
MDKTVYIFSGWTHEAVDRIADQLRKANEPNEFDKSMILLSGNLPEYGKRVTTDKVEDITFADFIQEVLRKKGKVGDSMADVSSVLQVEINQVYLEALKQQIKRIADLEKLVPLVGQLITENGKQLELIRGLQDQINKLLALREADNQAVLKAFSIR